MALPVLLGSVLLAVPAGADPENVTSGRSHLEDPDEVSLVRIRLVPGEGTYPGPVGVRFETSEPAIVYYTTDGSRPTLESPRYEATEFREPGQTLDVTETTTFRWFSVDTAANIEQNYDPTKTEARRNYRQATITITDGP